MTNRLVDYFVITSIDNTFTPVTTSHLKTVEDVTLEKVRFKTNMMDRFPFKDYPDAPLSHEIGLFCLPGGVTITEQCELPTFFVFVLTGGDGARTYGACLNFFEGLDNEEELHKLQNVLENLRIEIGTRNSLMTSNDATDSELENDDEEDENVLGEGENEMLSAKQKRRRGSTTPDTTQLIEALSSQTRKQNKPLYISKSFCLISHWPFFQSFKTFLTELYRISITPSKVPIERIISNFLLEVPLPPQGVAQVQYSIGEKTIVLSRPPPNDLPLSEVNYELLFKVLSVDNILFLFNCILNERQILFYSTHPSLLGTVAEALSSFIFPLHWHHVYIPVLPRSCIEFISAPVPFIMGCDSSFLHGVSIPVDVIKVNLDNNMVGAASTRLPKLPERQYNRLREEILKLVRDRGAIRDPTESSYFDLQFIDVAFNLAPIPEEITQYGLMVNVLPRPGVSLKPVPFNAHEVRMTFFRFFVSYLQKYKSFIINDKESEAALQEAKQNVFLFEANAHFKKDMFIRDLPENAKAFSRVFLETQAFQRFLMDRLLNEDIASIKMFTESVQNKLNRFSKIESMLTKKETTFLNDRSSQVTKTIVAISPDITNLPPGVYVYPYFPKLNHTLINPPREIKHLVNINDVLAQQTSITSVMPNRYNKDIMDSWKTILTTLVALSNQVGKRRSTALMGKFRKAPEIVIDSEKPTPQGKPTHKRGHTRTLSVPISSGSIGDIGEIDFTDIETDLSQLSNNSGNQINFGGASLFVENKQNSAPISRSVGALSLISPSSPISTASSGSYDPSNMPPQPEFDDGIMNQRTDSEQQQVRAKEIESSSLFSRFTFNTRDKCPSCNFELTDQDIRSGWTHSTQEYRTSCPQCQTKFVPRFTVIIDKIGDQNKPPLQRVSSLTNPIDCETVEENDDGSNLSNNTPTTSPIIVANGLQSSPPQRKFDSPVKRVQQSAGNRLTENIKSFMSAIKRTDSNLGDSESSVGSHHNNSASSDNLSINYDDHHTYHKLKYEYLSPIVLKKEVENLLSKEVTADAKLFKEHPLIFWNLICHFRGLLIPLNFLLPQVDWLTVMDELTSMIEQTKTASSNSETTSMSLDLDSDALMLETLERMNNELLSMQSKSRQSSPPTLLTSK